MAIKLGDIFSMILVTFVEETWNYLDVKLPHVEIFILITNFQRKTTNYIKRITHFHLHFMLFEVKGN